MNLNKQNEMTRKAFMEFVSRTALGVSLTPNALFGLNREALNQASGTAKSVIYLNMKGGMSQMDTFDVKDHFSHIGYVGAKDGERVCAHLPKTAAIMDRVTSINSMTTNTAGHAPAQYILHHSYSSQAGASHPSLGAWILKEQGRINQSLPGYITIGGNVYGTAGFLGGKYAALPVGHPDQGIQNTKRHRAVTERDFQKRVEMFRLMNKSFLADSPSLIAKSYDELYVETANLMNSKDLEAFNLSNESPKTISRYAGDNIDLTFAKGCVLARRLVEKGVKYVEVTLDGWDTHIDNDNKVQNLCQILDSAYSSLILDLESRGLLDSTLVVLATEFGRKPLMSDQGGRGHHPGAFTTLLAGGGVKAGIRYGKTDETASKVLQDKVTPGDLNATIAHCCGVDVDQKHFDPSGRLFKVAGKKSEPIWGVLS